MQSYYRLNIGISNAIRSDWTFPKLNHWASFSRHPSDIFNPVWLEYMTNIGLEPDNCLLFYTPPGVQAPFSHSDRNPTNGAACVAGFNFVVGEDPLDMVWFDPMALNDQRRVLYTDTGIPYETFPVDFDHEIDRCRIGNTFTMVRTDIPHWIGASIPSTVGRWSVSYRTTRTWSSWEDCLTGVLSGSRTPALSFGD